MSFRYETIRIENRLDPMPNGKIITNNKGDLIVDNGTKTTTLSVGSNGQALMANSGQTEGVEWKTLAAADISDFDVEVGNNTVVAANTAHAINTSNPHSVTKSQVGLGEVQNLKVNLDASVDPLSGDDSNDGYSVGSIWLNTTTDKGFICLDNTISGAVWTEITSLGEFTTASNIGTGGVGVFKQKNGLNFEFKKINNASNRISITDDTSNNEVDIDINEGNVVINNLSGAPSGAVVGTTDSQILTNKTFTDNTTYFQDHSDNTKKLQFELSGITSSNTRILTVPDLNTTIVGTNTTQTLSNKTFSDNLNMNNNKIINIGTPTADTDVANKMYVDGVASGLSVKDPVKLTTTDDLNSNVSISGSITYNSTGGSSSRGQITATLSSSDTFTLDSVNLSSSDNGARVLIKDQSTGSQNGVYTVTISGTSLTLDRATDFDEDSEVISGSYMFVQEGSTYDNCGFVLGTNNPITIGGASGTSLSFVQYSGAGQIIAGTGITKSGNTINAIGSSTIIANADSLEVNSSATSNQILLSSGTVGTAATYGSLPLSNSNSVSGILGIANGGTNTSSFSSGSRLISTNSGNTALEATSLNPANIATLADTQTLLNKTFTDNVTFFQDNLNNTRKMQFDLSSISTGTTRTLTIPNENTTLIGDDSTHTLQNKTISADSNTLTNIANGSIKSGAGIDASKLADGSVTNTEFQYLNGISSGVVGVSDSQTLTNKTFTDNSTYFQDNSDNTKKIQFELSSITTSNTRIITIPDSNITLVGTTNSQILQNKTINNDNNTITNVDNGSIKSGAAIDASKIANGSVSNAEFQRLDGITDTVVSLSDTQTLTNKTLTSPRIQTSINDINGNELVKLTSNIGAVNEITIENETTGNGPIISASGNNADIDLLINPKGDGNIVLDGFTWPNTDGTANQVLKTDGAGGIGFADVSILETNTVTTTNNTETTIATIPTSTDIVYLIEAHIVGRRTDSGSEGAGFVLKCSFRNNSGTVTKIGEDKMSAKDSDWDVNANISGTNIILAVTGENSKTINWKSSNKMTTV